MEGLIHMDGRVYDSTIGRFVSSDIHVPHPYSTQSYNRYSYVRNNPLGFTDPSGYSDADKIPPTITSPENKQKEQDTTPNGSVSFTDAGMYVKGPLQRIYFPNSPVANMTIANTFNFVNSYTNTALNGINAAGSLLEPYDGAGYSMMMNVPYTPMRAFGAGVYISAKGGRVLRFFGTMGQSETKFYNQLSTKLSNMSPAHLGPFGKSDNRFWTSTKNKTSIENAFGHWKKHGKEFSEIQNAKQYVDETKKFMTNPPKGTLTKTRNNGDNILYNEKSNIFGVMTENGTPKTMFRPNDGIKYFEKQK